ncbi:hypothetical protein [Streptomyces halobius]|uniref:Uncharacterized protein n=1 Tax=Streptomyces halobius TaxID=2879846 RepID=A0ABY4MFA5_9ACTN|nr:hypothetical protein [Streptomyces halobius]UQA96469.1 hypothetical protein K9S39_35415 [Streptomyces halobius]
MRHLLIVLDAAATSEQLLEATELAGYQAIRASTSSEHWRFSPPGGSTW